MFPFGFDVTVTRSGVDKFGDPLPAADHIIRGCAVAPMGSVSSVQSKEATGAATTVLDHDTLYAPYDADIVATDTITIPDGQAIDAGTYSVDGRPQRFENPYTGTKAGTVVRLTRGTG